MKIIDKIVLALIALIGFFVILPLGFVGLFSVFVYVCAKFTKACLEVAYEFVVKD